jgi:hypothetical protein
MTLASSEDGIVPSGMQAGQKAQEKEEEEEEEAVLKSVINLALPAVGAV